MWDRLKPFVFKTIWIVLPILGVLTIVEILYTKVPNEYSIKSEFLENHLDSIEVVIFGPSVTLRGINPEYFDRPTYNASLRGLELELDNLVISQTVEKSKSLDHIILSIAFNDFHHKARKLNASTLVYFSKYFGLSDIRFFVMQARGVRLVMTIYQYYVHGKVMETGIKENGFRVFPNKRPMFGKKAEKLPKSLNSQHPEYVESNKRHLLNIIETCEENDIYLTMLNTPLHRYMLNELDQDLVEELETICGGLAEQYDHVSYLNWMEHPAFDSTDFQDPIHLYEHGANKLSRLLNEHINEVDPL